VPVVRVVDLNSPSVPLSVPAKFVQLPFGFRTDSELVAPSLQNITLRVVCLRLVACIWDLRSVGSSFVPTAVCAVCVSQLGYWVKAQLYLRAYNPPGGLGIV
jgi:hypothetical protein